MSKASIIKKGNDTIMFDGYDSTSVESTGRIEVVGSGDISDVLDEFSQFVNLGGDDKLNFNTNKILTPLEINGFLQASKVYDGYENYYFNVGYYSSKLIQNSFDEGHNNFTLDIRNHYPLNSLVSFVNGSEDRLIDVNVYGNPCQTFARRSQYLNIKIHGSVGWDFAVSSKNVTAKIFGDVGRGFGSGSNGLTAYIDGRTGNNFGEHSIDLKATVEGNISSIGPIIRYMDLVVKGDLDAPHLTSPISLIGTKVKVYGKFNRNILNLRNRQKDLTFKLFDKESIDGVQDLLLFKKRIISPLKYALTRPFGIEYNELISFDEDDNETLVTRFK